MIDAMTEHVTRKSRVAATIANCNSSILIKYAATRYLAAAYGLCERKTNGNKRQQDYKNDGNGDITTCVCLEVLSDFN